MRLLPLSATYTRSPSGETATLHVGAAACAQSAAGHSERRHNQGEGRVALQANFFGDQAAARRVGFKSCAPIRPGEARFARRAVCKAALRAACQGGDASCAHIHLQGERGKTIVGTCTPAPSSPRTAPDPVTHSIMSERGEQRAPQPTAGARQANAVVPAVCNVHHLAVRRDGDAVGPREASNSRPTVLVAARAASRQRLDCTWHHRGKRPKSARESCPSHARQRRRGARGVPTTDGSNKDRGRAAAASSGGATRHWTLSRLGFDSYRPRQRTRCHRQGSLPRRTARRNAQSWRPRGSPSCRSIGSPANEPEWAPRLALTS